MKKDLKMVHCYSFNKYVTTANSLCLATTYDLLYQTRQKYICNISFTFNITILKPTIESYYKLYHTFSIYSSTLEQQN